MLEGQLKKVLLPERCHRPFDDESITADPIKKHLSKGKVFLV